MQPQVSWDMLSRKPFELNEITVICDKGSGLSEAAFANAIAQNLDYQKAKMATAELRGWPRAFEGLIAGHHQPTLLSTWCALTDSMTHDWNDNDCDADKLKRAIAQLMDMRPPLETIEAVSELIKEELDKVRIGGLLKGKCIENESVEVVFNSARNPERLGLLTYLTCDLQGLAPIEILFERLNIERPRNISIRSFTVSEAAGETLDAILSHIEATIKGNLGIIFDVISSNAQLKLGSQGQKRVRETTYLILCYIPPLFARVDVLKELRRRYETILFLVHLKSPEEIRMFKAVGAQSLTPPLSIEKLNEFKLLAFELDNLGININF